MHIYQVNLRKKLLDSKKKGIFYNKAIVTKLNSLAKEKLKISQKYLL